MKRSIIEKVLDITLAVCAVFFLTMGISDLGEDLFGVPLGLGTALPLALVYLWRKLRERKGKSVRIRPGTLALFCVALFFWMMGVSSIASDRRAVLIGLPVALPVGAIYLWSRLRELREMDAGSAEQLRSEPETALTVCPYCGAPSREAVCPYCGRGKKA